MRGQCKRYQFVINKKKRGQEAHLGRSGHVADISHRLGRLEINSVVY